MEIEKNIIDRMTSIFCWVLIIGTGIFLLVYWNQIPEQIPGHYNASGEIDHITDKNSLFFLYFMTWLMFVILSVITKFPALWNTGITITEENKEKAYRILKDMLGILKSIVVSLFCFLTVFSTTGDNLPSLFLPVGVLGVFGSMAISFVRLLKIRRKKA